MLQDCLLVHKDWCVKHFLTLKGGSVFSLCGTWSRVPSVLLLFKLDVMSGTLLKSAFEIKHINKLDSYRTETGKVFAPTCQHFHCLVQLHQQERITEPQNQSGWKKTLRLLSPTFNLTPPFQLDQNNKCHVQKKYKICNHLHPSENNGRGQSKEQLCLETLLSKEQLDIRDSLKQCTYLTKINLMLLLVVCFWRQHTLCWDNQQRLLNALSSSPWMNTPLFDMT